MWGFCVGLCFGMLHNASLHVLSSFAMRKTEVVALLLLSFGCIVAVNVLWLFLVVPWVGLRCVIVVFPDYTHLLFGVIMR